MDPRPARHGQDAVVLSLIIVVVVVDQRNCSYHALGRVVHGMLRRISNDPGLAHGGNIAIPGGDGLCAGGMATYCVESGESVVVVVVVAKPYYNYHDDGHYTELRNGISQSGAPVSRTVRGGTGSGGTLSSGTAAATTRSVRTVAASRGKRSSRKGSEAAGTTGFAQLGRK